VGNFSLTGPTGRTSTGQAYYENVHLEFEVDLRGYGSRVKMNGQELLNVRDIKVHQPLEGPPIVTIEFLASSVKGWADG
jgi:hypothetical protein